MHLSLTFLSSKGVRVFLKTLNVKAGGHKLINKHSQVNIFKLDVHLLKKWQDLIIYGYEEWHTERKEHLTQKISLTTIEF